MTRKTRTVMWTAALIGIFLTTAVGGLFGKDDPAKVTQRFWKALKSGGTKAARSYTTKASQADIDKGMTMSLKGGNVIAGETKIQGNRAAVITKYADEKGMQFTTILMKEDGEWKVDLTQTVAALVAGGDIGKQMEAMGAAAPPEPEESTFLLADMGWGDPFIDPRDRVKPTITPDDVIPELGDAKKKIWEDALAALMVEVIIGLKDDLAAVVSRVRVRPGDTIIGDKLKFKVEKITSDAVYLRCISEEEAHKKFLGITVRRKIPL